MIGGQRNSSEQDMTKMSETILWLGKEHARTAHKLRRNFPLGRNIQPKLEKDTSVSVRFHVIKNVISEGIQPALKEWKQTHKQKQIKKKLQGVFLQDLVH